MRIIISPAKTMSTVPADRELSEPVFLKQTRNLMEIIRGMTKQECQKMWNCNGKLAELNYDRFQNMNLEGEKTPAVFAYDGIQYRRIGATTLGNGELFYLQEHLRILSGFYGVLKPLDGIVPYRLQMAARIDCGSVGSLYDFWGDLLRQEVMQGEDVILNLASKEYGRCIETGAGDGIKPVTVSFTEVVDGAFIQRSTASKTARGEMVRYLAETGASTLAQVRRFSRSGYEFREDLSDEFHYMFVRKTGSPDAPPGI